MPSALRHAKTTPLVSVIVPAYNSARFLRQALDSALEQDYPNVEVIVVDDGSTDETCDILDTYRDRIVAVRQNNAGASVARNVAIERAQGEYLAFLDADDLWLPTKLSRQIAHLETNSDVGMVYSDWLEWAPDESGEYSLPPIPETDVGDLSIDPENSGWLYNKFLVDCIVHTTTAVIRRSIVQQVGQFDLDLKRGQDYDYWCRVSRVTRIDKLQAVMSLYRIHSDSITHKPHATNYGYLVVTKALDRWGRVGPDGTETPRRIVNRLLARMAFGYGYNHYVAGDPTLARDAFWRCIRHRPFWPRGWLSWGLSCLKAARRTSFAGKGP